MKQRNGEAGFTLVSVLIAMILLTVGIMAMSRTQSLMLAAHTGAATRTTALEIARAYLENLRTRDPATLVTEAAVRVDETGTVNANGAYTRSVLVQDVPTYLKRVTVQVTAPGQGKTVSLMTTAYVNPNPT